MAALKASRLLFLKFDGSGHLRWVRVPSALTHAGRLRAVTTVPNGDLLVTTDNGERSGTEILRVEPRTA